MKMSFGLLSKCSENDLLQIETEVLECDTDWFENTIPSIKDTHLFLPDWEDADDLEWVAMYFINDEYDELLQNNEYVLCPEAKLFLMKFKELKESNTPSDKDRKLQMDKLVCDLQKRNS